LNVNKPQLHKDSEISLSSEIIIFSYLSHSPDTPLVYDLVFRDKQSQTEYWQGTSPCILFKKIELSELGTAKY